MLQRGGVQRCVVGWHGRRGKRRKFCSQLVVASIMIGRLCKVLWACVVQRRGRWGGEEGERGRTRAKMESHRAAAQECNQLMHSQRRMKRLGAQAGGAGVQWMNALSPRPLEDFQKTDIETIEGTWKPPCPGKTYLWLLRTTLLAQKYIMTRHVCSCRSLREAIPRVLCPLCSVLGGSKMCFSCPRGQGSSLSRRRSRRV